MANVYVNFDLASAGDGTSGNPYGAAEFWTNFPGTANTWYAQGTLNAPTTNLQITANSGTHTLRSWDVAAYGPYRMKIQDIIIKDSTASTGLIFEYGIVECRDINCNNNIYGQTSLYIDHSSYCRVTRNMVQGPYIICIWESTWVIDGTWAHSSSCRYDFRNGIVSGTPSGTIALGASDTYSCASASRTLMHGEHWSNSQFSWTPPATLPYYDSPRTEFDYRILSAGITTPPQPGYLAGSTGLWGGTRVGIGKFDFIPAMYVDFDLASGGDGTSGNPYGIAGFKSNYAASNITWYARGSWNEPTFDLTTTDIYDLRIIAWDSALYGPPRINIRNMTLNHGMALTGCILYCSNITIADFSPTNVGLNVTGCFFKVTGTIDFDIYNYDGYFYCNFGTIIAGTLSGAGGAAGVIPLIQYSVIDAAAVAVNWKTLERGQNSAFTGVQTPWWVTSSPHYMTDCQFSWTPPVWPAWSDAQDLFNYRLLSIGISTPPEPGNLSYAGLWGENRLGIGGFYFKPTRRIIFTCGTDTVEVDAPQYGYETELKLGLRYKEHAGAKWGIYDRTSAYDYRILKSATFQLSAADQALLNAFFLSPDVARGETVSMDLGDKPTGFFPFGPDKGDVGTFTVRVLSYVQSGMLLSPYKQ